MDTPGTYSTLSSAENLQRGGERSAFVDPWAGTDSGQARRDSWMLSYIDILTLLLTLFVLLLVLQPKYQSPAAQELSELAELAPMTPIERKPAAVRKEPIAAAEEDFSIDELIANVPLPVLSADFGAGAAAVMTEAEISIEMLGAAPFLALASLTTPQVLPDSLTEPQAGAPAPRLGKQPAKIPGATALEVSRNKAVAAGSEALATVMAKLAEHRLDRRLKVSQINEGVQLEVRDNILFAQGRDQLKPEGRHLLDALASVLSQHQGIISVEGHTDNRPISSTRFPSNWELSSGRATTVTRYLIEHGLDSTKLRAVGYADTRPLESNDTPAGRTRNRRVSLILELPKDQEAIF